ncbi:MAG: hypothetical protein M1817_002367 [Caeruleum heppii]|nr:MAG: hypothetical protein M1817_002367 [Caeruleum heppii]
MVNAFATPVFFVLFRETLETTIIVAVLLAFLKQTLGNRDEKTYKKLVKQVWWGTALGCFICIAIGAGLIGAFYSLGQNLWSGAEAVWEGVFSLVATVVISVMGGALLRVSKLQDKWRVKLARALEAKDVIKGSPGTRMKRWAEKYAMFLLPFITVLREGLEAVVFMAGVSVGQPASAFPIPVLTGLVAGCLVGWLIYKGGNMASIKGFLIVSTCFLYLVAAGLFSKAVLFFEMHMWNIAVGGDAAETGAGAGSYDLRQSVWHVNCCSPNVGGGGGWGVFNSLFGWTNSATYGSVISYNLYWLVVIGVFASMRFREKTGHWPLLRESSKVDSDHGSDVGSGNSVDVAKEAFDGKLESGPVTSARSVPQ